MAIVQETQFVKPQHTLANPVTVNLNQTVKNENFCSQSSTCFKKDEWHLQARGILVCDEHQLERLKTSNIGLSWIKETLDSPSDRGGNCCTNICLFIFISTTYIIKFCIYLFPKLFFLSFPLKVIFSFIHPNYRLNPMTFPLIINLDWHRFIVLLILIITAFSIWDYLFVLSPTEKMFPHL
jgi:hypothetical protein